MSDEFKIQMDEKEQRAAKRKEEFEVFKKNLEMEKSKRELRKQLQIGTHLLRATAEMLDMLILEDLDTVMNDKALMDKTLKLIDVASEVQEVIMDDGE